MKEICDHDHVTKMTDPELKAIEDLPKSRAGTGRHRCACCAYLLGLKHGLERGEQRALGKMARQLRRERP